MPFYPSWMLAALFTLGPGAWLLTASLARQNAMLRPDFLGFLLLVLWALVHAIRSQAMTRTWVLWATALVYAGLGLAHVPILTSASAGMDVLALWAVLPCLMLAQAMAVGGQRILAWSYSAWLLLSLGILWLEQGSGWRLAAAAWPIEAPSAWMVNPNDMACLLALCLTAALCLSFSPGHSALYRLWLFSLYPSTALGIALTQSRLGLVLLAVLFPVWLWSLTRGKGRWILLICLGGLLSLAALSWAVWPAGQLALERGAALVSQSVALDLPGDPSLLVRWDMLKAALENWEWRWTGFGPRTYQTPLAGRIDLPLAYRNLHAYVLEVQLAFGSLAWLAFCLLMLGPIWLAPKPSVVLIVLVFVACSFGPSSFFRYHYWLFLPYLVAYGRALSDSGERR